MVVCSICGKSVGLFESKYNCSKGHSAHKKCLVPFRVNFDQFKNCKLCILQILSKLVNNNTCLSCKEIINIPKNRCPSFKNFHEKCTPKLLENTHMSKCEECQSLHNSKVSNCESCSNLFENSEFFKTPKCQFHSFCKNCINNPDTLVKTCDNCKNYFTCLIPDPRLVKVVICNLCGKFPDGINKRCNYSHNYCRTCFIFMTENNYLAYNKITTCEYCIKLIEGYDKEKTTLQVFVDNPEDEKSDGSPENNKTEFVKK